MLGLKHSRKIKENKCNFRLCEFDQKQGRKNMKINAPRRHPLNSRTHKHITSKFRFVIYLIYVSERTRMEAFDVKKQQKHLSISIFIIFIFFSFFIRNRWLFWWNGQETLWLVHVPNRRRNNQFISESEQQTHWIRYLQFMFFVFLFRISIFHCSMKKNNRRKIPW